MMSFAQIAERENISEAYAYVVFTRAMDKLRRKVASDLKHGRGLSCSFTSSLHLQSRRGSSLFVVRSSSGASSTIRRSCPSSSKRANGRRLSPATAMTAD